MIMIFKNMMRRHDLLRWQNCRRKKRALVRQAEHVLLVEIYGAFKKLRL